MIGLIRSLARRVLPRRVRAPVADRAYAALAWMMRARDALLSRAGLVRQGIPGEGQPVRAGWAPRVAGAVRQLPAWVFAATASALWVTPVRGVRRVAARSWHRADTHRHLLARDPVALDWFLRLQRGALRGFLALPDPYFRWRLQRFARNLERCDREPQRMRCGITFMIGTLGPGGAERQAVLTLAGLQRRGYPSLRVIVHWLEQPSQRFFQPPLDALGVKVVPLLRGVSARSDDDQGMGGPLRSLPRSLGDALDYAQALQEAQPAVAHLWLDECNIKGGLAAVAIGIPRIVLGLRSLPPCHFALHQPYMRAAYRWLAKRRNVVLVNNSQAGASAYEKWLGMDVGTIRVIHNGFDFQSGDLSRHRAERKRYRTKWGIPESAPVLGTVIRMTEEKRPKFWLEIASRLHRLDPGIHFLVVGDGPMRAELESFVITAGLRRAVTMTGHDDEPFTAMAAMDLFLLTSRAEGLPNVLIEAQALGVPVVTSNAGGAAEAVSHGFSGWVLAGDDVEYACEKILALLGDATWRAAAAQSGPAFVDQRFSVGRMLDQTLAVYGEGIYRNQLRATP